jgi:hypothetical protein
LEELKSIMLYMESCTDAEQAIDVLQMLLSLFCSPGLFIGEVALGFFVVVFWFVCVCVFFFFSVLFLACPSSCFWVSLRSGRVCVFVFVITFARLFRCCSGASGGMPLFIHVLHLMCSGQSNSTNGEKFFRSARDVQRLRTRTWLQSHSVAQLARWSG